MFALKAGSVPENYLAALKGYLVAGVISTMAKMEMRIGLLKEVSSSFSICLP